MKMVKVFAVLAVVCLVAVAGVIYSGIYNMGADQPHGLATLKLIEILREQSINAHAKGIEVPALKDPKLIAEGAEHYAPMCSGCHLAPGMEDTEIRKGLYPQPPNLAQARPDDGHDDDGVVAARKFWIIKHGIKLSGMPAWGTTHDDQSIWALVAFVHTLPELSAAQYQTMTATGSGPIHGGDDHNHTAHQAKPEQPATEEGGHVHGHSETSDTKEAETNGQDHGTGDGHAHDSEGSVPPHSH